MPLLPLGPEPRAGRHAGATAILLAVMGVVMIFSAFSQRAGNAEISDKIRELVTISNAHPEWEVRHVLQKVLAGHFSDAAPWGRPKAGSSGGSAREKRRFDALQSEVMRDLQELPLMKYGFVPGRRSWYTYLTAPLIHAGIWHLLVNAIALWWAGGGVEVRFGARSMLLIFAVGAVAGEIAYQVADSGSPVPLVGASGGAAALFAGFAVLTPKVRFRFLSVLPLGARFGVPVIVLAFAWALFQVALAQVSGSASLSASTHLGGFGAGLVAGAGLRVLYHHRKRRRESVGRLSRIPIWVYPPPFAKPKRTLFLVESSSLTGRAEDDEKAAQAHLDSSLVNR